ncbi:hypothetical protein [Kitasatospora sp. NPDC059599]
MDTLLSAFWLLGNVVTITLLGVLLNPQPSHHDAARTPMPSRSAPDVGEA